MSSQLNTPRVIRFGLFELDLAAGELRKRDRNIKLQGQPFQVLLMLLRHPGEVVSREELQQALWPADTFVEFDQGLNTAIRKIRLALGDSADNPRFIETIPRRGYRFVAAASESAPPAATTRRPFPRLLGLALGLTAAVAAAVWLSTRSQLSSFHAPIPVPLTTYPGEEWSSSFSPDGSRVAFRWQRPEQGYGDIYVKQIGENEPLQLTHGGDNNFCPAWSPDGRSIAFLRDSQLATDVMLIPAIGGAERKLAETVPAVYAACMAWDISSRWLIVSDRNTPGHTGGLFAVAVDSGEKRRLTTAPQPTGVDETPAVSPDGTVLAFARGPSPDASDLYLLRLSTNLRPDGEPKRITFEERTSTDPAWAPDGRTILFTSGTVHSPSLYSTVISWPTWTASKPQRLAFAGYGVRRPAISRQGRLAYGVAPIDTDIWRLELDRGGTRGKVAKKVIVSTRLDHTAQYSPDGKHIAFASDRSGGHEIWVASSDGSNTRQLTNFGEPYTADPYWSPDSLKILFNSRRGGRSSVYLISAEGGTPRRLTPPGFEPSGWSRDGKWVYANGSGQVWKFPPSGGQGIQITRKGGDQGVESPDGKFFYYLKNGDLTSIWRVPPEGGEETQVLPSAAAQYFAVTELGIYFFSGWDHPSIKLFRFDTGKTETVAQVPGSIAWGLSVSPDRRFLLYSMSEDVGADLWLVDNFWR